jgi:hydroxymethylpyrimidine/phosphomethylpyrimidine kinase
MTTRGGKRERRPVVLTIAGSDSGGGAGIQADLKTFEAHGVHGASVVTTITAQNPGGVTGVQPIAPAMVALQIKAVLDGLDPKAAKTGMLYSAAIIDAVATALARSRDLRLVVDPVMVATSGAVLLKPNALRAMKRRLFPRATLLTPNLDEAALLLGRRLATLDDLRVAARDLHAEHRVAVLMKGGHLRGMRQAVDLFYDGRSERLLASRFLRGVSTHGTGCTYAAAIAANLGRGRTLIEAIVEAKRYIAGAIAGTVRIGRFEALNW